jgi:hypothetical protein
MPIRMEDDPIDPRDEQDNSSYNYPQRPNLGGGGGGGLFNLLPLLLSLFRGKSGLLLLAVLGIGFFLLRGGCGGSGGGMLQNIAQLATGGFLDPRQFEKANIYEPLAEDNSRNPLPEAANLQRFAPAVGNQGQQGSCVAWSSAYAARTILESARTGQGQTPFSPAFLYNQIGLEGCQGSYIIRAMEYMTKQGAVPYERFPYTDQNCSRQPDMTMIREAGQYKMRGFNRLSLGDRNDAIDMRAIKENLAQGAPVVIGMMVGQSFMQGMRGKDLWVPEANDKSMMGFGGHAMCLVGYDDRKYGGAFLIMNSWGPEWGTNGFAWVRYPEFNYFTREAYGLEPMARTGAATAELNCEIGLVQVQFDASKKMTPTGYINLRKAGNNAYETVSPIRKGSKFKVEVKNNNECFIYIFGMETDGSAYTLFPYPRKDDPTKTKYSPFMGITGYRLFPRDKSMTPDSIGNRDKISILVSRKELNWYAIQGAINKQPASMDWADKVRASVPGTPAANVSFSSTPKGNIQFSTPARENEVVYCIVEFSKQ